MSETKKKKSFRETILSWGAKILLSLLVLSFGVWGIGDYVAPQQSQTAVATIGDVEISSYEFQGELRQQVARLQGIFGGNFTNEQAKAMGIGNNVLQTLIQQRLFTEGAKSMGLLVSNDLVSREIRDDARFKSPGGDFNRLTFSETIQRAGLSEQGYIDLFRKSLLQTQFLSGIQNARSAPSALADQMYRYRNEKRIANYIEIKHSSINTVPAADDEALKKFHKDNAARFTAPEYRAITLVQMRIKDIVDEIDVSEEQIKAAYDDRINEFKTPETRKIQQILLSDEAKAKEAYSRITGGEDYVKVAKAVANLDAAALDLGTLTKTQLPLKELADAAFSQGTDTVSAPVKSPLGWHILKITEIKGATQKTLAAVRADLKKGIASEKAVDSLYTLSNKFEDELGGGASITEAAQRLNFKIRKIAAINATGVDAAGKKIADIAPNIIQVAFGTEQDQDSALTDFGNSGYFILHVDGVTAPALKPFAKIRSDIETAWKSSQQATAADKKVKALVDRMKGATTLAEIAKELKVTVKTTAEFIRTGAGLKAQLPGAVVSGLFKAQGKEAVSGATDNTHFIAQVKDTKQANPVADKKGLDQLKIQLSTNISNDITTQLANALRVKLGVTINRSAVNAAF
jgi:peptidyl-prolyl cis-trans isomerase D